MNKHLYLCHPLVLSSPTLMMHGHMNLKFYISSWRFIMALFSASLSLFFPLMYFFNPQWLHRETNIFMCVRKTAEVNISFVMSVRLSVWNNSAPTGRILM